MKWHDCCTLLGIHINSTTTYNIPPLFSTNFYNQNTIEMQNARLLTIFLFVFFINNLSAQSFEEQDINFGNEGNVTIDIDGNLDNFQEIKLLPNGQFILAGYNDYGFEQGVGRVADFALAKLNKDGSYDENFGEEGIVTTNFGFITQVITAIMVTSKQQILVAGYAVIENEEMEKERKIILVRYHEDGQLDEDFGEKGLKILTIENVSINNGIIELPEDKFILTSYRNWKDYNNVTSRKFGLVGFNPDGEIDNTFGINGTLEYSKEELNIGYFNDVVVHKEKIYLAGSQDIDGQENFALARFNLSGQLDTLFGDEGITVAEFEGYTGGSFATKITIQDDESIVLIGDAVKGPKSDFALARFDINGLIDESFGVEGKVTTEFSDYSALSLQTSDYPKALFFTPEGKILVIGHTSTDINYLALGMTRYDRDGKIDPTFGVNGKLVMPTYNADTYLPTYFLRQEDDKFLFAGLKINTEKDNDFQLIRFLTDLNVGTIDFTTKLNNAVVYPNPIQKEAMLEYTLETQESLTIQLTDLNGRILKTYFQNEPQKAGDYQQTIDLPINLPKGFYLIRLATANGHYVVKVVK